MAYKKEIKETIAQTVLKCLKNGVTPWKCHNRGVPENPLTGERYSGINMVYLDAIAHERKYFSKYWATYAQWKKLGFTVRKPENHKDNYGIKVLRYSPQIKGSISENNIKLSKYLKLEAYSVFSLMQCDAEITLFESLCDQKRKIVDKTILLENFQIDTNEKHLALEIASSYLCVDSDSSAKSWEKEIEGELDFLFNACTFASKMIEKALDFSLQIKKS